MADEVRNPEGSSLTSELEAALTSLDAALLQASRSVAVIRSNISQFTALAEVVRDMEAAMTRARQHLSMSSSAAPQAATPPPLRPVPPQESVSEPFVERETPTSEAMAPPSQSEAPLEPSEREAPTVEPTAVPLEPEPTRPVSHCLRLSVSSKAGSLDLKAVDGSVNENSAVVDVALLDYDGRHATLKLWINGSADPNEVREALLASLRSRLGDERDAEVRIDFEEGSAA